MVLRLPGPTEEEKGDDIIRARVTVNQVRPVAPSALSQISTSSECILAFHYQIIENVKGSAALTLDFIGLVVCAG
jgi:hypothetical protein